MKINKNRTTPLILILLCISLNIYNVYAQKKIVLLHTNDTHSRVEPLPATDKKYPGKSGYVNRMTVIDSIRNVNKDVILIDAGDFVQGTPYFNIFKGCVEIEAMNLMKYDVGTLGNHEFDYGIDTLAAILKKSKFPVVNCNYDFTGTVLENCVKPYIIIKKSGVKIGFIGVGANPEGLISKSNYKGVTNLPDFETVNRYAERLKTKEKCDVIVCLSHLGIDQDLLLAKSSKYLDIIIGGHSHSYMVKPELIKNRSGKDVFIYQAEKDGVYLGKIEIELNKK